MALIDCAECGRSISDQASSCPGCGAPPAAYVLPSPQTPTTTDAHPAPDAINSAVTLDGRFLWYFPVVRAFVLGEDPVAIDQVRELDKQKALRWTRYDVREQMHRATRRGGPMGDLPADPGPGVIEKISAVADDMAEVAAGAGDRAIVCPHCHTQGYVRTKHVKQKKGVSGGKATAAVLTGGLSLLAVGLSRKERATEAFCAKCHARWTF